MLPDRMEPIPYSTKRPSTGRDSRTFKPRRGRLTAAETQAVEEYLPKYILLPQANVPIDFDPLVLDVGFGNGETTVALASEFGAAQVVGIDVHTPGFGVLARALHDANISNVSICDADALDVLRWSISDHSVSLVNVAFPDPWPKVGQQHKRLVSASFLDVLATKLKPGGTFRFATDWAPYADVVDRLFTADSRFERSDPWGDRPLTKFEARAIRAGRPSTDLAYSLVLPTDTSAKAHS